MRYYTFHASILSQKNYLYSYYYYTIQSQQYTNKYILHLIVVRSVITLYCNIKTANSKQTQMCLAEDENDCVGIQCWNTVVARNFAQR